MSEDQPVEAETATPETGTPNSTEELYQKRYSDLRPEYDRTQNELHQARSELLKYTDPESRRQIFDQWVEEYGYTKDEGEQYEYEDPTAAEIAQLRAEQAQIRQELQERDQRFANERALEFAESYGENRLRDLGITSEKQADWIASRAAAMPALQLEGGIAPDIDAAYAEWNDMIAEQKQSWAGTKDVPHTPSGGQENTGVPAWSDDPVERQAQRQAHMLEQWNARQG
jgi:hypothetical protein